MIMKTEILTVLILTCLLIKAQSVFNATDDEDCNCIHISECGIDKPLRITLRQLFNNECDHHLHICCNKNNIKSEITSNLPPSTCGQRNPQGLHFKLIDANLESQYAEFPWMIGIFLKKEPPFFLRTVYSYHAGGSLITPSVIVTAAHKVIELNATQLMVRAGEWQRNSINECYPHQDRNVSRIITLQNFNVRYPFNGIAILIMDTPLNLESHINTICLPPKNFDFTGSQCYITGWGADARNGSNSNNANYVQILKKIDVPVISDQDCQNLLRQTNLGPSFYLHRRFMCAGGEKDKDACFGDGGSPLVCPIPDSVDKYYLAGIVIGGVNCGLDKVPGIYIEVSSFIDWINVYTRIRNISNS